MEKLNSHHAKKILQKLEFSPSIEKQINKLLTLFGEDNTIEVPKIHAEIFYGNNTIASANSALNRLLKTINDAAKNANLILKAHITADKKVGAANRKVWLDGPPPLPNPAYTGELKRIPENKVIMDQMGIIQGARPIIAILTFNKHETEAIRDFFPQKEHFPLEHIHCFSLGVFQDTEIIHCISLQGEDESQNTCNHLINNLQRNLKAIIGAGIAFGINESEQNIGDVLISEDVQGYELARISSDSIKFRGKRPPASHHLISYFNNLEQSYSSELPTIHRGTILSGNKLIDNIDYRNGLNKLAPDIIGGEMEAIGIYTATRAKKIDWIIVKGICDFADGKKNNPDKEKHQKFAAKNAATVIYKLLSTYNLYPEPYPYNSELINNYQENMSIKLERHALSYSKIDYPLLNEPTPKHKKGMHDPNCTTNAIPKNIIDLNAMTGSMDKRDTCDQGEEAKVLTTLLSWAKSKDEPNFFALLGEYGMGKTVTCQLLYVELTKQRKNNSAIPMPLLFDLRNVTGLDKGVPTLANTLEECMERGWENQEGLARFDHEMLHNLLEKETAVVIFDGLDEVLVKLNQAGGEKFTANLLKLYTDVEAKHQGKNLPTLKILFSCRTQFFRTLREQKNHFTCQERGEHEAHSFKTMNLLPLTEDQVRIYLENSLIGAESSQIMEMLKSVHNLEELSRRPYTLRFIRDTLPQIEKMRTQGKTIYGVTIYRTMVQQWLERDSGKHHIKPDHKLILAAHLAAHLWRKSSGLMPAKEIEDWVFEWLDVQPAIKRRCANITPDQLEEDLRTATFLSRQDEGENSFFRFAHTSLQEYFLADYLFQSLKNDIIENWQMSIPSHETLIFLGQMLAEDNDADILTLRLNTWCKDKIVNKLILFYTLSAIKHDLPRVELYNLDFSNLNLEDTEFMGKNNRPLNLAKTMFTNCNLRRATFKNAILEQCSFNGAKLSQAKFLDCNATGTDWKNIEAHATTWRKCELDGGHWGNALGDNIQFISCTNIPTEQLGYKFNKINISPLPSTYKHIEQYTLSSNCEYLYYSYFAKWLPDGRHLIYYNDFEFNIIDVNTGKTTRQIKTNYKINCLKHSANGQEIITAGPKGLEFWEINSGKKINEITQHHNIEDFALSSNSSQCLIVTENKLQIISIDNGTEILSTKHNDDFSWINWSVDDKFLLTQCEKKFTIWNANDGKKHFSIDVDDVNASSFSPNGKYILSFGEEKNIFVWEVQTGNIIHTLTTNSTVFKVCFSTDGLKLAVVTYNENLFIYDTKIWQIMLEKKVEEGILKINWSADMSYLYILTDSAILITIEANSGLELKRLQLKNAYNFKFFPNNNKIIANSNNGFDIYDIDLGEKILKVSSPSIIFEWDFSPNGTNLLTYTSNSLQILSLEKNKLLQNHSNNKSMKDYAWSTDGTSLLSISDNIMQSFDLLTGCWNKGIQIPLDQSQGEISWSPDRSKLMIINDERSSIRVFDCITGKEDCKIITKGINNIDWAPNNSCISVQSKNSLTIFSAMTGDSLFKIDLEENERSNIHSWSPDSKYIATLSNNIVSIWTKDKGDLFFSLKTKKYLFWGNNNLIWSPDSLFLVDFGHKKIKIIDIINKKELKSIDLTLSIDCAWSPDGTYFALSDDGTLKIFNTTSWQIVLEINTYSRIFKCKWSPDGSKICIEDNCSLQIWDSKSGELLLKYYFVDDEAMVIWDVKNNKILHQQGELWPHFSWKTIAKDGPVNSLPFEALDANAQPITKE